MLQELGYANIPVFKGCANAKERTSEAVDFLIDTVDKNQGNIAILATGSLTNLYAAYQQDKGFFTKVSEIVLMGGITEPLFIGGKPLRELNFSCDPYATYSVLKNGNNLAIATGNNCLGAYFSQVGYEQRLSGSDLPIARYLYEKTAYWYEYNRQNFALQGFYNWDVVAAAYLLNKQFFFDNESSISPTIASLRHGSLISSGEKISVKLPKIISSKLFEEHVYNTYFQVQIKDDI